ncbi:MAG: HPr(Ser) kinase/phosphatase [Acidiferrobacterales bacterium]|jgi:HPr kinase/phosphorylase|nr:HPr(Ser) kinase/phosphatase [Acidiferrobacterales bacterium]
MNPTLTISEVFDHKSEELQLKWVAGMNGKDRLLELPNAKYPGMALVGHLSLIHPNRVQVLGKTEIGFLDEKNPEERQASLEKLFSSEVTAAVIVSGTEVATDLIEYADKYNLALFNSTLPSPIVIELLQHFLSETLATRLTRHGVYIEVMGIGVFVTGESGIGKSELALELMSRGHRLVADDAVEFYRSGPDTIVGHCMNLELMDYLEVRGLGVMNVRSMFGETAVRRKKQLHFIIHLEKLDADRIKELDRIEGARSTTNILGVDIPEVVIFVAPGRNLAVLLEAATRTHILRMWGMDPAQEFLAKQRNLIDNDK